MEKELKKVAIFGCGVSALSFLHSISPSDRILLKIFEKKPFLSNRANTISIGNNLIDNGANYLATSDPNVLELIFDKLDSSELIEIQKWVFPFDQNGKIDYDKEKAKTHNGLKKLNYKSGIANLSKLLIKGTQFKKYEIIYSKKVTHIQKNSPYCYQVFSNEEILGEYHALIFSTPTPDLLKILMKSKIFDEFDYPTLLLKNQYKTIYSLSIGFQGLEDLEFYALINIDRKHRLSWVSIENDKQGHVFDKDTLVIGVQSSHDFSLEMESKKYDEKQIIEGIKTAIYELLPFLKEKKICFEILKKWKNALPGNALDSDIIDKLKNKNIFVLGDGLLGKGRLDFCLKTGMELYENHFTDR